MSASALLREKVWAKFATFTHSICGCKRGLQNKDFAIHRIPGKDNPGDLMTKYLDAATMLQFMEYLGLEVSTGTSEIAPKMLGLIDRR